MSPEVQRRWLSWRSVVPGWLVARRGGVIAAAVVAFAAPFQIVALPATVGAARGTSAQSSSVPDQALAWNAVSVKLCLDSRGRGGTTIVAPPRLTINCQPVTGLIATAYLVYGDGKAHAFYESGTNGTIVAGEPAWARADRYTVNATALGTPSKTVIQGPMMQKVLEERFKLKVHREHREVSVYNLVIARGGARLQPFKAGSCVPLDMAREDFIPTLAPGEHACESMAYFDGPTLHMDAEGTTLEDFARGFLLGSFLDRRIVNKTGLTGRYDIHLAFAPRGLRSDAGAFSSTEVPTIDAALRDLGLQLHPAKGTGEFLVIDQLERPMPD